MKIIVLFLVFRNHDLFHPFQKNPIQDAIPYQIDFPAVEQEVKKMLLPNQKITLIRGCFFFSIQTKIVILS